MTQITTAHEVRLTAHGRPGLERFRIVETPVPVPGPGQVLVRNRYLAMRAAMGLLMAGGEPTMPAYRPGEAMWGPAVGEVVAGDWTPGILVAHDLGWREYALLEAAGVRELPELADPVAHLAQAETAYAGLVEAARLRPGDTVFVSSAAGSIGTMAGQIARLKGAGRVVGSAGSAAKVAWLVGELGFDAAFDHHEEALAERLREVAPEGVDVYFDNVGGEQLVAAIEVANPGARMALCGALAGQTGRTGQGLATVDTRALIAKRISLRGFTARDHPGLGREEIAGWLRDGRLTVPVTRFAGLREAPRALLELLDGRHTGTVIVEL
ncbi:NADP-dependent oxidoreductase [Planotetraspora sp. A-T 1434]|uniref:MDR family NADP-dependent oxidoreductase n=1 Tax=Planotetraspora sp. A-T 1434 TaxID=2979219 RepID=UPI0021C17484|nr:NADP-dependent oxidoreductase [Planotetraspora sp. A-T 1434]MCT9930615.1 NADP-dependent oxidoreductase [Planotetraspora sp. A-T 1434]